MFPSVVNKRYPISTGPAIFAGSTSGTAGSNNGTGSNASFNSPYWIARGNGAYFVSDTSNHTIRKIVGSGLQGVVTTIFGTPGTSGSSLTTLNSPRGIAADSSNNLYVADYSNNRVLYIANGSSTASNLKTFTGTYPVQVVADSNGSNVLIMTTESRRNIYQVRSNTFEGIINLRQQINGIYYPITGAALGYRANGSFYFTTAAGQVNNQVGMYRMQALQPPTLVTLGISNITQPGGAGTTVYVQFSSSASAAGFGEGQLFNFTSFTSSNWSASSGSYTDLLSYTGTVIATDQSAGSNITFKYTPSNIYTNGVPNSAGAFSNSSCNAGSSYSNLLGIGWDNFIGAQTVGNLSPDDVMRMNFYFTDSSSVFPSVSESDSPTPLYGSTTTLSGFTGTFAIFNGSYSDSTYYTKVCDATSGNAAISTFTLGVTSGSNATQSYTNKTNYVGFSLAGYRLWGPSVPEGTTIVSDTNTGQTGTITLTNAIITTSSTYYVSKWPYGSKRVVQLVFPQIACPTGSYTRGGGRDPLPTPNCTGIVISNSLNGVSVNGAPYGYSIANIQFSPTDSNTGFSSMGTAITKYNISNDTFLTTDSLTVTTYSPPSFTIFDSLPTPELMTIIPNSSSNTVDIYYKRY